MSRSFVNRDPEILGGTPVFIGTRVPIKAIFDYLKNGDSQGTSPRTGIYYGRDLLASYFDHFR
ncbi:hypothetical protein AB833_31200 [Chromatiales bacterium (ex Bugula neritina AB1)]|nr:hypothetical protein AB833_31200 [Chromatiales bacterium (ex Bugula neritina AB1)]